jgi:transcriptional regulator with XRE-family HTH domain
MTIGQALKRLRKKNKMKQEWVASCTKIGQQRLSCIENDKIPNLTIKTLSRLARFYKLKPSIAEVIIAHLNSKNSEE